MQSSENKIISNIYGRGRGWAFSQKDFSEAGSRQSIDTALHRLEKKKTIRRVMRGIYDYPKYSKKLGQELSPDIDQVAHAIARKFGWHIQPSGPAALNILGISTQVPGQFVYHSSGPDRSYQVINTTLTFQSASTKETGFKHDESAVIVQALKSLGKEQITPDVIAAIRKWLDPSLRSKILKDTKTVTGWVYKAIQEICREARDG